MTPIQWVKIAAKHIPWGKIIGQAPKVAEAVEILLKGMRKNVATEQLDPMKSKINDLEAQNKKYAELLEQLAKQVDDLTATSQVLAARIALIVFLTGTSLILAAIAIVIAVR